MTAEEADRLQAGQRVTYNRTRRGVIVHNFLQLRMIAIDWDDNRDFGMLSHYCCDKLFLEEVACCQAGDSPPREGTSPIRPRTPVQAEYREQRQ